MILFDFVIYIYNLVPKPLGFQPLCSRLGVIIPVREYMFEYYI